jgi:hypothetical protein
VTANPLSLLADVIPARARKYVYAVVATALFVYSIWEASNGDLRTFGVSLGSALVAALAAANTPAPQAEVVEAAVDLVKDEPEVVAEALKDEDSVDDDYGYRGF